MKKATLFKWKTLAGLAVAALLGFVGSAPASLVMTGAYQQSATSFTPTWTVAPSLIAGMAPTTQSGTFTSEGATPGVSALTDGVIGPVSTAFNIYAAGGSAAGTSVIYTLPTQTDGYDITNITVYSGWANGGRVGQAYTVLYSTVANPGSFIWLTNVSYSAGFTGNAPNNPISIQVQLSDSAGGVIAANVAKIQFNFTCPTANDENSGSGYSEITVQGNPSVSLVSPVISITAADESGSNPFTPTWVAETPNLIAGLAPTTATGTFIQGGPTVGPSILTDGAVGVSGVNTDFTACGANAGTTLIYTLPNVADGTDVTNIVVYSGWQDNGRFGQYYTVSYSTIGNPTTFVPITTVFYLPENITGAPANRVSISMSDGSKLAGSVANLKFDFAGPPGAASFNNGWQGYSEIVVQGTNSTVPPPPPSPILVLNTVPNYAETVVGDQVEFTAIFSNSPPASVQWLQLVSSPAATNVINTGVVNVTNNGVVTSTLTLTNVQLTSSGSYELEAVNATNGAASPAYSTPAPLVVRSVPAAVNNVIVDYAGETFSSTVTNYFAFFPPWPVDTTDLNLISGSQIGSGPGTFAYLGDFSVALNLGGTDLNVDPTILTDGLASSMPSLPDTAFCGCGRLDYHAGYQLTYTLETNSTPYGYDLTNITVFGGWQDGTHNQQDYQVLYSTMQSPASFVPLATVSYLPTDITGSPTVTRTTVIPASGVLVHNVAAVQFNFNLSPIPEGGYEGYSEILVGGQASTGIAPSLISDVSPNTASDVVGSQIVLTASFANATSLQWLKNGTNVPGATASTLTLNNLQMTDAGSYSLLGSNSVAVLQSSSCLVTVNPAPIPGALANYLVSIATQTSLAEQFTPTWNSSSLSSSLIYGLAPSSSSVYLDFEYPDGNGENAASPVILTDGSFGYLDTVGDKTTVTCAGSGATAGNFVIYTLAGSANGYTITNIMSSGGLSDDGRDQQAYTILYSTVAAPTTFLPLAVVNYLPFDPTGISTTRATITPVTGALATNVAELYFDFTTPAGENGYEGYNEIAVYGSASGPLYIAPVLSSATASGGNLIVTGTGGYPPFGAYTWLMTTNLSPPVVWTTNSTGTLDGTGSLSNSFPINPSLPASFFRLQIP